MALEPQGKSSNFGFLAVHSQLLADLGSTAERLYPFDPASCVLKLRLLAESLTQEVASRIGLRPQQSTQAELLRAVDNRLSLDPQVRQMFHFLRTRGNEAAHQANHGIGYREGLEALKVAREVALWFHRSFGSAPSVKIVVASSNWSSNLPWGDGFDDDKIHQREERACAQPDERAA